MGGGGRDRGCARRPGQANDGRRLRASAQSRTLPPKRGKRQPLRTVQRVAVSRASPHTARTVPTAPGVSARASALCSPRGAVRPRRGVATTSASPRTPQHLQQRPPPARLRLPRLHNTTVAAARLISRTPGSPATHTARRGRSPRPRRRQPHAKQRSAAARGRRHGGAAAKGQPLPPHDHECKVAARRD